MFRVKEYREYPDRLADLLPWAAIIAPGVVLNKDGSFQKTIALRGPDLASSTDSELVAMMAQLNNVLKRLGSGWALYTEAVRQESQFYPKHNSFKKNASLLVEEERYELFHMDEINFESNYYMTFQYLPETEKKSRIADFIFDDGKSKKNSNEVYNKALAYFEMTVNKLTDILNSFMFDLEVLDDEKTLTYLHQCISTKKHPIKKPATPMYIDSIIVDEPLVGGLEPRLGNNYLGVISVLGFPSSSYPGILDQLNRLPIAYRWVTRYIALDTPEAEKLLSKYRKRWFAKRKGLLTLLQEAISKSESAMVDTAALRKSVDADEALQALGQGYVSFGYYTMTITVADEDQAQLTQKLRELERVINALGFSTMIETVNSVEAWLSSLPGQAYANIRKPLIHTLNLSHLIPFSAVWSGQKMDEHFEDVALFYARTLGQTPFRYVMHIGDVGHQMIIGPTGAGKSVLLNFMALQFLRYKQSQVFIFDKGGSFFASTMGVEGAYYAIADIDEHDLVFQPLRYIDDEQERLWAVKWICGLLVNENIEITADIKTLVWEALCQLSEVPQPQRTLSGFQALVQDKEIRAALTNYTLNGAYGQLFDAGDEQFSIVNWQCFEMETLMNTPDIVPPVLYLLFHRIEKQLDGRPSLIILDEAWLFLDHPIFAGKIKEWLKTLRKKNASVIFATQSVDDLVASDVASSLIESCAARVFLPNHRAVEPGVCEVYQQLGLNQKQIEIISTAVSKRQYYYSSPLGSALIDLSLGDIALAFCAVNQEVDKQLVQKVVDQYGKEEFCVHYLVEKAMQRRQELKVEEESLNGGL